MRNVEVSPVKILTILRSKSFMKGFNSIKNNIPFDYTYVDSVSTEDAFNYERGRQFSVFYRDVVKVGKRVTDDAILAYSKLEELGSII